MAAAPALADEHRQPGPRCSALVWVLQRFMSLAAGAGVLLSGSVPPCSAMSRGVCGSISAGQDLRAKPRADLLRGPRHRRRQDQDSRNAHGFRLFSLGRLRPDSTRAATAEPARIAAGCDGSSRPRQARSPPANPSSRPQHASHRVRMRPDADDIGRERIPALCQQCHPARYLKARRTMPPARGAPARGAPAPGAPVRRVLGPGGMSPFAQRRRISSIRDGNFALSLGACPARREPLP